MKTFSILLSTTLFLLAAPSARSSTLPPAVDLKITQVQATTWSHVLKVYIKNEGFIGTSPTCWLRMTKDPQGNAATTASSATVPSIAPGATRYVYIFHPEPVFGVGECAEIDLKVDCWNAVAEFNEANNVLSMFNGDCIH